MYKIALLALLLAFPSLSQGALASPMEGGGVMLMARRNMMCGEKLPYARRLAYLTREQYDDGSRLHGRDTGPYIDTGIVPDGSCEFYIKALTNVIFETFGFHFFGVRDKTQPPGCNYFGLSIYSEQLRFGDLSISREAFPKSEVFESSLRGGKFISPLGNEYAVQAQEFTASRTLPLFGLYMGAGGANERFPGRVYNFKMWKNGILVIDYIPVLDKAGRPAMYNQVNGEFAYNVGTGEFGYGEII